MVKFLIQDFEFNIFICLDKYDTFNFVNFVFFEILKIIFLIMLIKKSKTLVIINEQNATSNESIIRLKIFFIITVTNLDFFSRFCPL